MPTPITVDYTRDGDDWKLTVSRDGETLSGTAPGLIAARDRADQLAEKLSAGEENIVVAHRLDGDAFAFTTAYLTARLARHEPVQEKADEATKPEVEQVTEDSAGDEAVEEDAVDEEPATDSVAPIKARAEKQAEAESRNGSVAARLNGQAPQERIAN